MDNDKHSVFLFQLIIDHMISMSIIAILIVIAINSYLPYRNMAKIMQAVSGSPFIEMRMDMMLYHAHHGEWPKDNKLALSFGWNDSYNHYSDYIKEVKIEDGAINFFLDRDLEGKIVTLRPAVPINDTLGPIIWVCGERKPSDGWTIQGVDRTNIDDSYINRSLQ